DIPVDIAHLIPRDVLAQLLEVHAPALEMTQVSATHHVVNQPVGPDFNAADGGDELGDGHERKSRHRYSIEDFLDDNIRCHRLRFGFIRDNDAVAQDIRADALDIFR